jgi:hypothetical protein
MGLARTDHSPISQLLSTTPRLDLNPGKPIDLPRPDFAQRVAEWPLSSSAGGWNLRSFN